MEENIESKGKSMLKKFIVIISISTCFIATKAHSKNWYIGGKLAFVDANDSLNLGSDNGDNIGIVLGYDWSKSYGKLGLEVDYTNSLLDGATAEDGVTPINESFFIDTLGLHATYKTLGQFFYAKFKLGASYTELSDLGSLDEKELDPSFGGGIGVHLGNLAVEIDYTKIDDFNLFSLSVLF